MDVQAYIFPLYCCNLGRIQFWLHLLHLISGSNRNVCIQIRNKQNIIQNRRQYDLIARFNGRISSD